MLQTIQQVTLKSSVYKVMLTIKVSDKAAPLDTRTRVDMTEVQILDSEGKPLKTIE